MAIGFMILVLGILGLVSLFRGNPGVFEPYDVLATAAGLTGAFAAHPLSRLVSPIGSGIVCAGARHAGALDLHGHARLPHHPGGPGVPGLASGARPGGGRSPKPRSEPPRAGKAAGSRSGRRWASTSRTRTWSSSRSRPSVALGRGAGALPSRPAKARTVSTASGPYQLPPLDLLRSAPASTADGRDEKETMAALERTLQTFGVDARVTGMLARSDRFDVRGRYRGRHQGEQGAAALERHRVRAGHARRADHRADPRQVRDRRRGAEQAPRLRDARRHPPFEGREGRDASAHGRARQGRARPAADGEPRDDAAHPHRGRHGRGQVQPDQLLHHVAS